MERLPGLQLAGPGRPPFRGQRVLTDHRGGCMERDSTSSPLFQTETKTHIHTAGTHTNIQDSHQRTSKGSSSSWGRALIPDEPPNVGPPKRKTLTRVSGWRAPGSTRDRLDAKARGTLITELRANTYLTQEIEELTTRLRNQGFI